ncbi:flagellar hook-length control protein FliK [Paenibacillus mesophilus]|uniref:flagellar hook-length control protein FliK n=1 Tax=Paenibacillus mesophilus TaxID=2582849 RepID=UPI00110E647D|nr:flagellar hook-length control protein FliK [Paenibacillus mesophilus]TMV52034.1 flagellar hook-length control protein FliK [Paenibacillus mesophilus]
MNAPFMLQSSIPSGGAAPLGVIVPKNGSSTGTNVFAGDAAFAKSLVQAMTGNSDPAGSAQTNMLATNLLAQLVSVNSAGGESQIGDVLSRLLADMNVNSDSVSELDGAAISPLMNALVSNLLAEYAADQSAQTNLVQGAATDAKPQTGDVLTQWLGSLGNDSDLDDRQDVMNDLMALLELAQAIIQQWQPVDSQPDVKTEQNPAEIQTNAIDSTLSAEVGEQAIVPQGQMSNQQQQGPETNTDSASTETKVNDNKPYGKHAELLQTLNQLADLLQQHPDQPEIVQIVESIEYLIAPMMKDDGVKSENGVEQVQVPVQSTAAPASTVSNAASVVPVHQSPRQKPAAGSVNIQNLQQIAIAPSIMTRGIDLKGRLEALAAKAIVQPQIAAVQATDTTAASDESNDTVQAGETADTAHNPLQLNQLRHSAPVHAAQPQEHFVRADRFADEMAQVLRSMKVNTANGLSEVRIMLQPEHLGHVDVKVSMQNGQIVAHFMADSAHGKELLESQLSQLRTVLQNQGLQVDRLEVVHYDPQYSGAFQDSRQQQQSRESDRNDKEKSSETERTAADFLSELERIAGSKSPNDSKSFDVTA